MPASVIPFLERDSSCRLGREAKYLRQSSPSALFLTSRTLSCCRFAMLARAEAGNVLLLSCNLVKLGRQSVMTRTPASPILFSPNRRDLSPRKYCSCWMSSSVTSWPGKSISSVSSVTVVFWMVTNETGLEALSWGAVPVESRSMSSLSVMSWIADYSLVLASERSLEARRREVSN